jgi:hypothetical protein
MSDGPYRSLPMSRSWKRLAEYSENENFDSVDTCGAATSALESTWRNEVLVATIRGVRDVFLEGEQDLFSNAQTEKLHAVEVDSAGYGLGRLLTGYAEAVLNDGFRGEAGLVEATKRTLEAYAARTARQIEEHYCRKASSRLTRQVRNRIAQAVSAADLETLARKCAGLQQASQRPASMKRTGIDDGVPL